MSVARGLSMDGIDYLKAMIARELPPPPMAMLMQFDLVDVEPGKVVFTCQPDASMFNPNGAIHGGLVVHSPRLGSRAGIAQHAARRQGIHVHRDQGELLEASTPRTPAR